MKIILSQIFYVNSFNRGCAKYPIVPLGIIYFLRFEKMHV
jgi:hypothetical protein